MSGAKNIFSVFSKGFLIGIGTIIPGVSGGTTAMILGCFEDIIERIGNFRKHVFKSINYLFPLSIGACISVYLTSPIITIFCEEFPTTSKLIFCTLSAISLLLFSKKCLIPNFNKNTFIFAIIGVSISTTFSIISSQISAKIGFESASGLFAISIPLSLALILPAISFSQMLYFFGIYEKCILSIQNFDFHFLVTLAVGLLFGTLVFSKILTSLLEKFKSQTYAFVFGFVLMSLVETLVN